MFAVLALFAAFTHLGEPLHWVPVLFTASIVVAGDTRMVNCCGLRRANQPVATQMLST